MAPSATPETSIQSLPVKPTETKNVDVMAAMAHNGKALPGIPVFDSFAEKRQWQLEHMAGAFRVFAREGYAEGMLWVCRLSDSEASLSLIGF